MTKLRVLSLFAGIGGFDLGLERTGGFETVAFCEIEPFAVRVRNKNWPGVPVYGDVRELTADRLQADGIVPDCIVGGFPCQDISLAGKGAGLAGERSGLWGEYARLIGEIRPRYVIVENVAALLGRGLGDVLGDLASLGYDAEWHCIPAAAVGAPHRRDRIWIVAYPQRSAEGRRGVSRSGQDIGQMGQGSPAQSIGSRQTLADAASERRGETRRVRRDQPEERTAGGGETVSDSMLSGLEERIMLSRGQGGEGFSFEREVAALGDWWSVEPAVGRVAHGVPDRVGQLRAYGNAVVVPQIPELIGRAILASLNEQAEAA